MKCLHPLIRLRLPCLSPLPSRSLAILRSRGCHLQLRDVNSGSSPHIPSLSGFQAPRFSRYTTSNLARGHCSLYVLWANGQSLHSFWLRSPVETLILSWLSNAIHITRWASKYPLARSGMVLLARCPSILSCSVIPSLLFLAMKAQQPPFYCFTVIYTHLFFNGLY
jgi:hypothetical protein